MNFPTPRTAIRQLNISYRYSIAVLLVALAVLPLSGAAWFAVDEVQQARSARAQALDINTATARLIMLIELQTGLLAERNYGSAIRGLEESGLTTDFVNRLTGLDLDGDLLETSERVDEIIDQIEADEVRAELDELRTSPDLTVDDVASRYNALEKDISTQSDFALDELLAAAGRGEGGDTLVTSLVVLRSAALTRQAASEQFSSYFAAQFSTPAYDLELANLASQRSVRRSAQTETQRVTPAGSLTSAALDKIANSPEVELFFGEVDKLIKQGGSDPGDEFSPGQSQILGDVGGIASAFAASSASTELYFELVDSAGEDVKNASNKLADQAQSRSTRAATSIGVLILISVIFTVIAIGAIGRPSRRLAETARRISNGDSSARFTGRGIPSELVDAGRAINEAAANLELAERQAKALAEGDLTDPVLQRTPNSALGESLQSAVSALASSLRDGEDLRERMTHEATHDGLTQLANRNASLAFLKAGLEAVRDSDRLLAVLFIDLDGFKTVNDNNGHHAGDTVLWTMADRLRQCVRASDLVGRIGGDEFVVISESEGGPDEIYRLANRLLKALHAPVVADLTTVSIGASIGIALSDGNQNADPEELLRDADLAVYKAKKFGRGRIEVCDDELRAEMLHKADLDRSLAQALEDDEFVLFYQPIVHAGTEQTKGYEALVRWNRPGYGLQLPDTFIPFAETSDMIMKIDQWVVQAAVRQLKLWDEQSINGGIPTSVNISSRHLSSPTFVEDVLRPLRDYGVDPQRIIVEVTESALLDDLQLAAAKLQVLRSEGVRVSIDDFGSGYTSLAHLRNLPIDILKIDQSFTADVAAEPLVKLIIDIGHLLGALVTAEGVETPEQAKRLTEMGCDDLQGYLFGKPQPVTEIAALTNGATL